MGRTFIRQDDQIAASNTADGFYDDTVAPSEANYETNPGDLLDDLNSVRSQLQNFLNRDGAGFPTGDWFSDLTAPTALETGTQRGIDAVNDGLHAIEKKRVLRCVYTLSSITIASAGNTFDILGTGELPAQTTAAVGVVTTLGTVVADHNAAFGAHSLLEVAGPTAISPKNLVQIVDAGSRDPVLDASDRIYGLLQSETAADGHTITDTTTTRVQISFVKLNGSGDDLIAITSGAMDGVSYDYCYVERIRLEDLNEANFLGGASVDVPSGSTVTRQVAYDNQGATVVNTTSSATLDIGTGLVWELGDDDSAPLLTVTEASAGSASTIALGAQVDVFDVDALVNNFAAGITTRSGGTRPINIGITDGVIETTAGDLKLDGFALLAFEDVNQATSTYGTDLVLSDAAGEWDLYETNFGEVSLLNAINQAYSNANRRKVVAVATANVAANADVSGPSDDNNLDADLGDLSAGTFIDDYDIFLNGVLLRSGVNAAANHDVYPGTALANGQLRFEFNIKGTGAKVDQITVIDYAE